MIIKVQKFGAIKNAEIDLSKKLSVFCGPNGTGKTYLAYLIYALTSQYNRNIGNSLSTDKIKELFENNETNITIDSKVLLEYKSGIFRSVKDNLWNIFALSENESKRLNKIIDYYEIESNRIGKYLETDWFSANSENEDKIERFRNQVENYLKPFDEDVIISWERKLTLKTTKKIFIKYWTDFLYPSSDDVTIISERTNWILFYNHCEVANIWIKSEPEKK